MLNPFLIGEKVYLRPLQQSDAANFVKWLNHPDIQRLTLRIRPLTLEEEADYMERMRQSTTDVALVIALKVNDLPIGMTGFRQIDWSSRHACFGIVIGETEHWGQGYGTDVTRLIVQYAFDTLNLNRVWLQVCEYNQRGIRCYERVGFRKEGLLRQEYYREGRYWDTLVMAVLREDWDRQRVAPLQ
jgi:UDP-4-amino-4,6-dideoxy-N-acetyl-beta-L-altrosamine N-acetyltransferase